ncbi:MAG: hypothetical protein JNL82_42005 [Myxococcales bacterium]|jgi:hypothetical protein|nr:hypothetical protein [Myxococcales bacterium]
MVRLLAFALLLSAPLLACDSKTSQPPTSGPTTDAKTDPPPSDVGASAGAASGGEPATPGPACGDKTCAAGEQCIEYFGVAGPAGPRFKECGIPCNAQKNDCPDGLSCVTIADGPGPVCKAKAS